MIIGFIITTFTIILGIFAWWGVYGFYFENYSHSYFAFPVLYLVLFLAATGLITRCLLTRSKWGTRRALRAK